ncbi:MAG: SDR family NAD(P)-dependent oxidoreductase [Muribaculaceae bacterium]|nr:SDR family NAD(P)-dependent oxidoreductase [Muribaculaceae bacterium]
MKQTDSLRGHLALLTGACGGIGSAFAEELARRGSDLILTDISRENLEAAAEGLRERYGVKVYILPADLTAPDVTGRIFSFCDDSGLDPDVLINNAGVFAFAPMTEISDRKTTLFIDLHVRAVTTLSREFAVRRERKGSGFILNMSSMSCWAPMPGLALYAATKAYIRVFSRSLHYEMRDSGVKVMVACPGGIATDLFGLPDNLKKLAVGIGALDVPDKFARKAISRLLRGRKQYINGWLNRFSIFMMGITPTPVRMMVKHRMLDRGIKR